MINAEDRPTIKAMNPLHLIEPSSMSVSSFVIRAPSKHVPPPLYVNGTPRHDESVTRAQAAIPRSGPLARMP